MRRTKDVLTTGEVAKICHVAPRTVSKWFDTGKLRGYRIPGSKDRRIPVDQLIRFMRAHGIPLNGLDAGVTRVLVVDRDRDLAALLSTALGRDAGFESHIAQSAFEAGLVANTVKPGVLLLDIELPGLQARELARTIRSLPDLTQCKIIAMTGPLMEGELHALREEGFDGVLAKPFEVSEAIDAIELVQTNGASS